MVVINPGNPTGQVLDRANQEDIIRFCGQVGGGWVMTSQAWAQWLKASPVQH